jgi:serine-type D-Ala-D-Ala carboxypeptidase/endopeptidase (penicillin-binding protein 4)
MVKCLKIKILLTILMMFISCKKEVKPHNCNYKEKCKDQPKKILNPPKVTKIKKTIVIKKRENKATLISHCESAMDCSSICCWNFPLDKITNKNGSLTNPSTAKNRLKSESNLKVKQELDKLIKDSSIKHGLLGFALLSIKQNKLYYQHNFKKLFAPASNMKLVTTGAALHLLDSRSRIETTIQYSGKIENRILKGDLYFVGKGDPSFGSKRDEAVKIKGFISKTLKSLAKKGIEKIDGDIVVDTSYFEDRDLPEGWEWIDLGKFFAPPISACNIHENYTEAYFSLEKQIDKKANFLKVYPLVEYLELKSDITTIKNSGENWFKIYGNYKSNKREIVGKITRKKIKEMLKIGKTSMKLRVSIPNPPLFIGQLIKTTLEKNGISVSGKCIVKHKIEDEIPRKIILTMKSPTINKLVYYTNYRSVNLYAESLVKLIGKKMVNKGTLSAGLNEIMKFWRSKGIPANQLVMADGSGLSRTNLISPLALVKVLKIMRDSKKFLSFYRSFPVSGVTGSVWFLGNNNLTHSNMRIKSGYINRVRAYSGYVKTKSGELLAFSIMVNNYLYSASKMRKMLYPILRSLAELD